MEPTRKTIILTEKLTATMSSSKRTTKSGPVALMELMINGHFLMLPFLPCSLFQRYNHYRPAFAALIEDNLPASHQGCSAAIASEIEAAWSTLVHAATLYDAYDTRRIHLEIATTLVEQETTSRKGQRIHLEGVHEMIIATATAYTRDQEPRPYAVMEVVINSLSDRLVVPRFGCTPFVNEDEYYEFYELCLTDFIWNYYFRYSPELDCAAAIAQGVVSGVLRPVNYSDECITRRVNIRLRDLYGHLYDPYYPFELEEDQEQESFEEVDCLVC